jgi:hypothetical protein
VVVVSGHEHHLTRGTQRGTDRLEHRRRHIQRLAQRNLTQLEHIAQEHQPIDIAQGRDQGGPGLGIAQAVGAGA